MTRYKVMYDKKACIGSGECENLSPEKWKVTSESKAELKSSTPNGSVYELEISEAEYPKQKDVAARCPSGCIKVVKIG